MALEADYRHTPSNLVWESRGKFFDALRPSVEPFGMDTPELVIAARAEHLKKVRLLFDQMDCFIFTLGLTEMWVHKESGTVYPSAPGSIIGTYDKNLYQFKNAQYDEIISDFFSFTKVLSDIRGGRELKIVLTVSPVPLTATAGSKHVLVQNSFSKSILRSVAGYLSEKENHIDYFPSYEIVTNPRAHSIYFENNLRSVRKEAVTNVMAHFFAEHLPSSAKVSEFINPQCEDEILEMFITEPAIKGESGTKVQVIGNSFISPFQGALNLALLEDGVDQKKLSIDFIPINFLLGDWKQIEWVWNTPDEYNLSWRLPISASEIAPDYSHRLKIFNTVFQRTHFWFVGALGMNRVGIMDWHPKQKPDLLDQNGKYIRGFRAGGIPIIKSEEECDPVFITSMTANFIKARQHLQHVIDLVGPDYVRVVDGPMMSEKCGRYWFGDEYVESGSQAIYNKVINKVINDILGDYTRAGILNFVDESHYSINGFTKNVYSEARSEDDMHVDFSAYINTAKNLITTFKSTSS